MTQTTYSLQEVLLTWTQELDEAIGEFCPREDAPALSHSVQMGSVLEAAAADLGISEFSDDLSIVERVSVGILAAQKAMELHDHLNKLGTGHTTPITEHILARYTILNAAAGFLIGRDTPGGKYLQEAARARTL